MTAMSATDLAHLLPELAARHDVPGVAAAVLRGDARELVCTGVTSTTDPLPVDEDTLYFWGSTTKTLTATALVSHVEAGRVSLDDLVADVLPELVLADPSVLDVLTVGMLLDHTGGWRGDGLVETGWGDDALERAVAEALPTEPQVFAPGTLVSYNNSALLVAGRVLEVVAGTPYPQAVTEAVLRPLGMTATGFLPWEVTGRRLAQGHTPDGAPVPGWPLTRATGPAGGAVGSLADHVRWAAWCLRGETEGTAPLSEEWRLRMQQPRAEARSTITGTGLSWLLMQRGPVRLVTHGGNVSNLQLSTFVMAPDQGLAVVVLSNGRGGSAVGQAVVDAVLADVVGEQAALPAAALAGVEGDYDAGSWKQRVTRDGDRLFIQMVLPDDVPPAVRASFEKPPSEVLPVGTDQLATADRPWEAAGDVGRDDNGEIVWLRWGMRVLPRVPA
jgi:CubicO group peptidase (beta-lactamase class C family)